MLSMGIHIAYPCFLHPISNKEIAQNETKVALIIILIPIFFTQIEKSTECKKR